MAGEGCHDEQESDRPPWAQRERSQEDGSFNVHQELMEIKQMIWDIVAHKEILLACVANRQVRFLRTKECSGHKTRKDKDHLRDSHIKKIRTDPLFLSGEGGITSEDAFSSYLAGVLNVPQHELRIIYNKERLKKVRHLLCTGMACQQWPICSCVMYSGEHSRHCPLRHDVAQMRSDVRGNYLHAALAAVRMATVSAYGDSALGTAEKQQMVMDCTYRDKDGERMGDVRFQSCARAWYVSIRRVDVHMLDDFKDICKLEFTREELALVDMEVRVGPLL